MADVPGPLAAFIVSEIRRARGAGGMTLLMTAVPGIRVPLSLSWAGLDREELGHAQGEQR